MFYMQMVRVVTTLWMFARGRLSETVLTVISDVDWYMTFLFFPYDSDVAQSNLQGMSTVHAAMDGYIAALLSWSRNIK